jgi:hypothetical protein
VILVPRSGTSLEVLDLHRKEASAHRGALKGSAQHFLESEEVVVARKSCARLTPEEIDEVWVRLRSGLAAKPTARQLGLPTSALRTYLVRCGGVRPVPVGAGLGG